jgi:[acyl-carrier-protein] S-malonyltransferase
MNLAFVFPGQGSQTVGMGRALAAESAAAAAVFAEADAALGRSITRLIEEGPIEELTLTWNAQPAILTASIACLRALEERSSLRPVAVAGHSLGEYTALVAAGALSFADAVRTVEKRGRFMQEAVAVGVGTMYAVMGLDAAKLEELCAQASSGDKLASVANDNCPGQVVISGHKEAVAEAARLAKEAGAKRAVELSVSAPFHCSLMEPAAARLSVELSRLSFSKPTVPVAANVTGTMNADAAPIPELLRRQVSGQVRWQDCVRALQAAGAQGFVEIGPGKVLKGLIGRIAPDASCANIEDPASLAAFVGGLS